MKPPDRMVGKPLRLEKTFFFPAESVTELLLLGEQKSSVSRDNWNLWAGIF